MKVVTYRDHLAQSGHAVGCRREERKLNRPAKRQIEFSAADLHLMAFFITARNETKRLGFSFAFQTSIKRVRSAAADPSSHPTPHQCVVSGSTSNRQLQRTVLENPDRSLATIPGRDRLDEPFRNAYGVEHSSIQKDGVRRSRLSMRSEKRGYVPRNRRILSVRQSDFLQRDARRPVGQVIVSGVGKETIQNDLFDFLSSEVSGKRLPNEPAALAHNG